MRRGRRVCRYIVIRTRDILGYQEHLGPVLSTPDDIHRDAERLYGKPGHTLSWVSWSKATKAQKQRVKEGG